ncbi:MAG TPA: TonB-dependent receptor [Caldimonas sp.]|nr:TonB-dependent receptor [Caldimonas sp.]
MLPFAAAIAQADDASMGRVEVVGSRIPRLDAETSLPVQIIPREEIERSGAQTVEEVLQRISANFGGHSEAMGLGDATTPGLSGASLHGFGEAETLVLLNGRRLANYAFTGTGGPGVDLHAIPLAAIERIEVLKDGASALYGSDAIGGVINFVTRREWRGGEATGAVRRTAHGGAGRDRATLAMGRGDLEADRYNAFAVLDVQSAQRLRAVDRPYTSTAFRPDLGLLNAPQSSFPANIQVRGPNGRLPFSPLWPANCPTGTVASVPALQMGTMACLFDAASTMQILPSSEQANAIARATFRVADGVEAYLEALGSKSHIRFSASPSPAIAQSGFPFVLPPSSPYYPAALGVSGPLRVFYRTVALGPRVDDVDATNTRLLAGMRASIGAWDVDGALMSYRAGSRDHYISGYADQSRLSAAITSGLLNPFGPSGPEGDALLQGTSASGLARQAWGRTESADLRATREWLKLPGGMLALATGIEGRHEQLHDDVLPIEDQVVGGAAAGPKDASRQVRAAYVELLAPLWPGFELQAAARADDYSDFGTTVSPKVAFRLQPGKGWLVRASIGKGFRAPSLPELYTRQTQSVAELNDPAQADPLRCPVTQLPSDCQPQVTLISGGNPELKPQRSTQASAGLLFEPSRAFQFGFDVWSIRVDDVIAPPDVDAVTRDLAGFARFVVRGPVDPAFPNLPGPIIAILGDNQNLGTWRVSGIDFTAAMRPVPTAIGRISARLDATHVMHARQEVFQGEAIDQMGRIAPRWIHVLTLNADSGPWTTTVTQTYRYGYADQNALPDGSTRRVARYLRYDLNVGYALSDQVQITFGIRNVFDTDPPFTNQSNTFQVGYDPVYADPIGRAFTLGLRARWR